MDQKESEIDDIRAAKPKQMVSLKKEELSDDNFGMDKTDFKKGNVILRYPSFERRYQLGVKKSSHSIITICFQDLMSWKVHMGEQHNLVLTELRTIPFEQGGNDPCMDNEGPKGYG